MNAPDGITTLRTFIARLTDPTQKQALTRGVDAFEAMLRESTCDAERLRIVVELAGANAMTLWNSGAEMLLELASRHEPARAAFLALARSPTAQQRFTAIALLDDRLPRPLVLDMLAAGLADRSARVRRHAFVRCNDLDARELVDEMTKVAAHLTGKAREEAEFYLALVRDGCVVELDGAHPRIVFMTPGTLDPRTKDMVSTRVPAEEATPDRLAATLARLRQREKEM
ncbi:hypothetical protein [Nannocystis radixulma]|uniref:HEAT repeat domain-containing protein n=1 Tax=Nannocystis radixulma TaxID=2995305 RepID=A0ABT5AZE1_9BACT|nr:hypothetical protein [Nannocystis radixulma]MDC0667204.1 hypothetical protein [Nannocystis radixulma]